MTREQFIFQVEQCQGALRRFLVALCCGDAMLADDIAQETFIKAYLAIDTLGDESRFDAWVYRIAYNTFVSARRSRHATDDYDAAGDEAAADSADSAFRYQELYEALNRVTEGERTVILLHYMEGYSIREIADIVASTADAVKQKLYRGRVHLKALIGDDLP